MRVRNARSPVLSILDPLSWLGSERSRGSTGCARLGRGRAAASASQFRGGRDPHRQFLALTGSPRTALAPTPFSSRLSPKVRGSGCGCGCGCGASGGSSQLWSPSQSFSRSPRQSALLQSNAAVANARVADLGAATLSLNLAQPLIDGGETDAALAMALEAACAFEGEETPDPLVAALHTILARCRSRTTVLGAAGHCRGRRSQRTRARDPQGTKRFARPST